MDPNVGPLAEEESPPSRHSEVIAVCDKGAYTITNADKDEDE